MVAEVNSNWSKIPIKDHIYIYNRKDGWFKTRRVITGYNKVTISGGPFKCGDTAIMDTEKVSCRAIETGQEFRNLGRWSWMLLQGKNNMRTRIITAHRTTESSSVGGAHSQQLESLSIIKIQNNPRTQF